jgi:hypothetical protein
MKEKTNFFSNSNRCFDCVYYVRIELSLCPRTEQGECRNPDSVRYESTVRGGEQRHCYCAPKGGFL